MNNKNELPIVITEAIRDNPHIVSGLAQEAFRLANYDMTPDKPVDRAIEQGLIVVKKPSQPTKIRRMPGNGSFA
ncbi:MAG TPA: hypothetical protein VGE13_02550 [Candidatus Saccharimonadales bacterium]